MAQSVTGASAKPEKGLKSEIRFRKENNLFFVTK